MQNTGVAYLEFHPELNQIGKDKELRFGLSAVLQIENDLWVANDETISVERLSFQGKDEKGNYRFGRHKQFMLNNFLSLPSPPTPDGKFEEADIEGMAYEDGYLWLVGSHSRKRKKIDDKDSDDENLEKLAKVSSDGNRFLLARIPLVKEDNAYTLKDKAEENGTTRTAAQLRGDTKSNELIEELKKDEHLKNFLAIPGKDNGLDIEGLAVANNKVFVGLRGPVLRGWAIILKLELEESDQPGELKLKKLKKFFLQLDGLGVRDLLVQDDDLLILTGPTMDLDGPVNILRWKNGVHAEEKNFVFRNELQLLGDIPYGHGEDHAEGITLFSLDSKNASTSLLVVYDAASKSRMLEESIAKADIFSL